MSRKPQMLTLPQEAANQLFAEEKKMRILKQDFNIQMDLLNKRKSTASTAQVCIKILNAYDESIPTYRAMGKCYLLKPSADLKADFAKQQQEAEAAIPTVERTASAIEKSINDINNNIADIIKQHSE